MRKAFLLVIILLPCTAWGFWPFTWEYDGERNFLGPVASYKAQKEETEFTFRPLLFSYDSQNNGTYHFLYPLGKITQGKSYFIPLYLAKEEDNAHDATYVLIYHGESHGRRYAGFFPFYGKMYNRFSKDELGFFLWPLYSYSVSEEARKTQVLFPFFTFYSGKEKGATIWPLYGDRKREGVKRTRFALWPVFWKQEKDLDTDEPMESLYAFPFYMQSVSEKKAAYNYLWPLFSYFRDEYKERWNIFWPVFSFSKGEQKSFGVFPFYTTKQVGTESETNLLWPFFKTSVWYANDQRFLRERMFLFGRHLEEPDETLIALWPLFEYRKKGNVETRYFPGLMPFRFEEADRIVKPMLTFFERQSTDDSEKVNLLYGFFTKESEGENWKVRLAFLFEMQKDSGKVGFNILSGLFGIDTKGDYRLFFIPIKKGATADPEELPGPVSETKDPRDN